MLVYNLAVVLHLDLGGVFQSKFMLSRSEHDCWLEIDVSCNVLIIFASVGCGCTKQGVLTWLLIFSLLFHLILWLWARSMIWDVLWLGLVENGHWFFFLLRLSLFAFFVLTFSFPSTSLSFFNIS